MSGTSSAADTLPTMDDDMQQARRTRGTFLSREEQLEVRARVATWPPLTPEQRADIAALFARVPSKLDRFLKPE